jgi:hypothetical protein
MKSLQRALLRFRDTINDDSAKEENIRLYNNIEKNITNYTTELKSYLPDD